MKGKNGEQDGIKIFLSTRDDGNMAFYAGEERGRSFENRERFFQERGLDLSRAIFLQQTHSDHILVVGKENAGRGVSSHEDALPDADALVTDVPGIALCVQVADCVPVLLFDPVRRVIAAVHSGWRGTLQNIVGKTVLKMADTFGSEAKDIQVWIGPAIEGSCFVVDDRIADPVKANGFLGLSDGETHWDISVACRGQLVREGVREENIDMSGECTVCNKEQYFSYKREGDRAGRMLACIQMSEIGQSTNMRTEYEATFTDIQKDDIRERLKKLGAVLVKPDFLQKRVNFELPKGSQVSSGWVRIRDEGDKITMSLKVILNNDSIEGQKELCLTVDDFQKSKDLLHNLGCRMKSYQESKREIWTLGGTEVCIDEWPWLPPFIEIEGDSEQNVRSISESLGFDWQEALFGAVDIQYAKKYNITKNRINCETPRFVFGESCPFI